MGDLKYGKLTVLESSLVSVNKTGKRRTVCKCRCDCGNVFVVQEHRLRSGHTKSCGCLKHNRAFHKRDLFGNRFGKLVVVKLGNPFIHKNGRKRKTWDCVCDCGNEVNVLENSLLQNNTTSCGCSAAEAMRLATFNDISGRKFGRLMAEKFLYYKDKHPYWLCKCDCGKIVEVRTNNLIVGTTKSCGCYFKERVTKHGLSGNQTAFRERFWKENPSLKLRHNVSNAVRHVLRGRKNGSTFKYLGYTPKQLQEHLEALWEPWMNWENYGGMLGDGQKTWHVDHIIPHSSFNYETLDCEEFRKCWALQNLRPLNKVENAMKSDKFEF